MDRVGSGELFGVNVYAVSASGLVDETFTGTITFSSTDPLATLPLSYTFSLQDKGAHGFPAAVALRTLGRQTIIVSDAAGMSAPGTLVMIVAGPDVDKAIPTLSHVHVAVFGLLLATSGVWLARAKR